MATLKITSHDGLTDNERTIQRIAGETLNRTLAPAGLKYWSDQLARTGNVQGIYDGIMSGSEFKNRQTDIDAYKAANDGAAPSEAYLDARIAPGGGRYTRSAETGELDGGVTFGANNTWSSPLMNTGNNTYTDEFATIQEALGIGPFNATGSTSTLTPFTNPLTNEEKENLGGGGENNVTILPTGPFQEDTTPGGGGQNTGGLTMDDLNSWWDGLDKSQFGGGSRNNMQDFMQFMMMMSMMGGFGRQGGGSQYGYGGMNPGGVMQANDPLAQLQNSWDWFQNSFGDGGTTSANLNVTG
tara:strand:+ start:39 stop:932 length:894 start_codon:yes stop_codon:yes gene_type:complete